MIKRPSIFPGLFATIFAFAPSLPAAAFETFMGQTLSGTIDAKIAGISAAVLTFDMDVTKDGYVMESDSRSRGLVRLFVRYDSNVKAMGRFENGLVMPEAYILDSFSFGRDRTITLRYGQNATIQSKDLNPTPLEEGRQLVPTHITSFIQTVDPAIMFLKMINPANTAQALDCSMELNMYDGYRMSKFWLYPVDGAVLRAGLKEAEQFFDISTAVGCYAEVENLYGRTPKEEERARERDQDDDPNEIPPMIWFAKPHEMDIMVPAVFNARTRFGTAIVTLTEFNARPIGSPNIETSEQNEEDTVATQ